LEQALTLSATPTAMTGIIFENLVIGISSSCC